MYSASSEERASHYLAGLMTGEEAAAFEREMTAFSVEEKESFAQLSDTASLVVMASVPRLKAPASARAVLMARAGITAEKLVSAPVPAPVDKFTYLMFEEGWEPLPFPGARIKRLFAHPHGGHRAMLLELQPGVHVPEHPHAGHEECLILRGDLINEGRRLGPGDYVRASAGTDHLEVYSEGGCLCLIIASAA